MFMPQHIPIFENRRLKEEFEDTKGVIRITGARGTDLSPPFSSKNALWIIIIYIGSIHAI
jgi:hypothetical protein